MAWFSWYHRRINGAIHMVILSLLGVIWGLIYLLRLLVASSSLAFIFDNLQFIPAVFIAPVYFIMVMVFIGRSDSVRKPAWLLLYLVPILSIAVIATNNYHFLLNQPQQTGGDAFQPRYNAWFWVIIGYSILLVLSSLVTLVITYIRMPRWSRGRITGLLLATVIIVAAIIFSFPAWIYNAPVNLTLIALLMSIVMLVYSLFSNRMLDIIPLGRSTLLSQLNDAVITLNAYYEVLDHNAAAGEIAALDLAHHIGESFPTLLEHSIGHITTCDWRADHSEEVVIGEGAESRTYDMRVSPLHIESHQVAGWLVVLRDISRRKVEEEERVQIQQRYRSIFNNSNYGIVLVDSDGKILEANTQFARICQCTVANLQLHTLMDLFTEGARINLKGGRKTYPVIDTLLRRKNGEPLPVELNLTPILGEGEPVYFATIRDISERKTAETTARTALESAQSRMDELAILRSVTESLNKASSHRAAYLPVFETVRTITKSPAVWLMLVGKTDDHYQRIEYRPLDENNLLTIENIRGPHPKCLTRLLEGGVDAPHLTRDCPCSRLSSEKNHYSFPLFIGKQPLGLLNFVEDPAFPVGENKQRLLSTVCDSFAVAVERVRLFKSEYDQRKLAETMRDINTALTTSLNLNDILDLLLDQLSRLIPYDGGNVILIEDGHGRIARVRGYELSRKKDVTALVGKTFEVEKTSNLFAITSQMKPVIIPDTTQDITFIPTTVSTNYHAWLGVPVINEGKVTAVFCLDKVEAGFYTEEHAKLLSMFASQAALAIRNASLYSTELRRIEELDGLRATLNDISAQLDVNVLLQEIVKRATRLLNVEVGELGLYEPDEDQLRILVCENLDYDTVGTTIKLGDGVMGAAAKNHKPLSVTDYQNWPHRLNTFEVEEVASFVAAPMLGGGGELLGVIGVGDKKQHIFSANDIRLLDLFAQQATVVLRNARLYEEARRRAEEADTIRKAGAVVVSTLNQDKALRLILEELAQVVPYDSASVLLRRKDALQIVGGRGFRNMSAVLGLELALTRDNPGARVFLDNKPLLIKDIPFEAPQFNMLGKRNIIRSWLGVPLTGQGKPIGILSLDSHSTAAFTEESARLVSAFADQVSIALENARLYGNALQAANRFETLYNVSQIISANIRSEEIYPAIHHATTELMETEFFSISLVDEKKGEIEDVYMVDRGEPAPLSRRPIGTGLFSRAIESGESLFFNTFDETAIEDTGAVLIGDPQEDKISQSILVVPLKIGTRVVGVLSAQSYRQDAYTETDLELLELLAANVAIAIENARLFGEVQELAITDPLTGLYNRRHLLEIGEQEYNRFSRYGRDLSAVMVDCDYFKKFNDTWGHAVGDQVLIKLADLCRAGLRQVDILARYGGDEYMILLPETPVREAMKLAERLRKSVASTGFATNAGTLSFTISVGVAGLDGTCRDLQQLLERADYASYVSKDSGGNRVTGWSPSILRPSMDKHDLLH